MSPNIVLGAEEHKDGDPLQARLVPKDTKINVFIQNTFLSELTAQCQGAQAFLFKNARH